MKKIYVYMIKAKNGIDGVSGFKYKRIDSIDNG